MMMIFLPTLLHTLKTGFHTGIASLLLLSSVPLYAHTGLASSTPADYAMLTQSPETIELTFEGEVRLVKLTLNQIKDEDAQAIALGFKPKMTPALSFSQAIPELSSGEYRVEWSAMGKDAHKMKGSFHFELQVTDSVGSAQTTNPETQSQAITSTKE
jgi:methionine-rich copper-binding protein CopC